jgi:hypothetical protein
VTKRVFGAHARNSFGGVLEGIVKRGQAVGAAVPPSAADSTSTEEAQVEDRQWGKTHMIPSEKARLARPMKRPKD